MQIVPMNYMQTDGQRERRAQKNGSKWGKGPQAPAFQLDSVWSMVPTKDIGYGPYSPASGVFPMLPQDPQKPIDF